MTCARRKTALFTLVRPKTFRTGKSATVGDTRYDNGSAYANRAAGALQSKCWPSDPFCGCGHSCSKTGQLDRSTTICSTHRLPPILFGSRKDMNPVSQKGWSLLVVNDLPGKTRLQTAVSSSRREEARSARSLRRAKRTRWSCQLAASYGLVRRLSRRK